MEVRKPPRVKRRGERGVFSKGRHHEGSPWSAAVQSTYIFCGLQCRSGMHPWPCHPRLRQMLTRLPTNPTPGPCRCHAPARAFFGCPKLPGGNPPIATPGAFGGQEPEENIVQVTGWLREKDCQLTFSEIVSPNSVEGVRLGTKSCIEKTRKFCRRNFASHSHIKSKSRKVASSVPVRVLLSQIAFPTRAPIPAVSAIANAPQKVTLIVGLRTSAPPALAPTIPSVARNASEPTETIMKQPVCRRN